MTMTDLPPGTSPAPPSTRRRWPLLALAAVVLAGVAMGAVALLQGDEDEERPTSVTSDLPDALDGATDADTAELAELLARGRRSTYHARYTLSDATGEAATVDLEVWRDGDRLRQDTLTDVEGQSVKTSSLALGSEVVLCSRTGEVEWSCAESQPTGSEQEGILGSVQDQLAGSDVTPRDDELDGLEVRCFAFSGPEGDGEVCVTPAGVPARVELGGVSITLVEVDDDVPLSVFAPPVETVQAAG